TPDSHGKTKLNQNNKLWKQKVEKFPDFHLWYPFLGSGYWDVMNKSDFKAISFKENSNHYYLRYKGRLQKMCIRKRWKENHWNNSPFKNLEKSAFKEGGSEPSLLVLATPCI
ncbi:MAG: hypothetical protein D6797_03115, partial [Bdellovibrio sp.]